jgi:hypothetical protein
MIRTFFLLIMTGALSLQTLQGNLAPCGSPSGGSVRKLYAIRAHEVIYMPGCCNETHSLTGQIEIAGNTAFKKYEFNLGELYFEEIGEDTPSGPLFQQEIFGNANAVNKEIVAEINRMTGGEYILWVELYSGEVRVVGTPENPAQLLNNIRHGRSLREVPRTDWRFYRKASRPACYVVDEDGNTPTAPNTLPVPSANLFVAVEANPCEPASITATAVLTDGSQVSTTTLPAVAFLIYSFGPPNAPWYTASIPCNADPAVRGSWSYISGTRSQTQFWEEVPDQVLSGNALTFAINPTIMAVRTNSLPLTLTVTLTVDERGQRSQPVTRFALVDVRHLVTVENNHTSIGLIFLQHSPCQLFAVDFDNGAGVQANPLVGGFDLITTTYGSAAVRGTKLYGPPGALVNVSLGTQFVTNWDVKTPLTELQYLSIVNSAMSGSFPGVFVLNNMPVLNFVKILDVLTTDFQATGSPQLIKFDASNNTSIVGAINLDTQLPRGIQEIWLDGCGIQSLKVGSKPNLTRLELDGNDLSAAELDRIIAELWAQRTITKATVDLRSNPGSATVSARSLAMINGTAPFTGNGLVQAGWTIFL